MHFEDKAQQEMSKIARISEPQEEKIYLTKRCNRDKGFFHISLPSDL